MSTSWSVRRIESIDDRHIDELANLLIDAVDGGASVSFMSGTELLQRIRRIHGDLPVILATGLETMDLCTAAESYGAVTCLEKPINLEELVWTIEMALACREGVARGGAAAI